LGVELDKVAAIVLYPADRNFIVYDGDSSLQDLVRFAMGEATNEFPYPGRKSILISESTFLTVPGFLKVNQSAPAHSFRTFPM
jgi:hypothetical protein